MGDPVLNGHTLAGFVIGALCLATMATFHLKALHKMSCTAIASAQPKIAK